MLSLVPENSPINEIDYWQRRVISLETLICELLTKNQRMRYALESITSKQAQTDCEPCNN